MSAGKRPEPKPQAMPMDRAILWNPPAAPGTTSPGRTSNRSPYPIFFQQEAVIALQEHLKSSPTQAIFGFLIGDLYRDPETGVLYTVIDKTLKLSQAIYGDKTEVVVSRLWERMQEQLTKASASLLGWYHSHPGQGGFLTAHDVETHEKFFTEPWHVAVLMAAEAGGVTGRFFRATQTNDWHKTPIAFYELLQPESIKPDGKKRSFITWRNYKAYGPTLTGPKPKAPEPEEPPSPPPPPAAEETRKEEKRDKEKEKGFRIMRSSADDIPVIRSSADDEPAPAREAAPIPPPEPVRPPPPPTPPAPPPPPPKPKAKPKPEAPVFVAPADERAEVPPPSAAPAPPPPRAELPKSDEISWAVTPESVVSVPPPVMPPAPGREPRRTPTNTFRLLDETAKPKKAPRRRRKSGPWLKRLVVLLVIAGIGAGGYWYFVKRNPGVPPPWAGLVDQAKKLVSRSSSPAQARGSNARRQPVAPSRAAAPPPAAAPFVRYDRLSDSLSRAVRNYRERADLFASGRIDCGGLATGLAAVESLWNTYNAERRARMANFDERRALQDQALYASVDSVESRFEQSGCPRR